MKLGYLCEGSAQQIFNEVKNEDRETEIRNRSLVTYPLEQRPCNELTTNIA